jgi:aryl-alcohol dehydrogenase-like predicted oxidoreductase
MREVRLGSLSVSAQGLGCMGMSGGYGAADWATSIETIHIAMDLGVTLVDTANVYGFGHNEVLVGRAIHDRRDRVRVASKFGIDRTQGAGRQRIRGDAAYVRQACEESLLRLGVDHIDLYYAHRVSPEVEIEETVGAMAELVAAGKVGHIGLCSVGETQLRRAHQIHPIAAVQVEYSLWAREVETLLPTLRELAIGIVSYSPLGRGYLTGTISDAAFAADDSRRLHDRLSDTARAANQPIIRALAGVAEQLGATPAQVAIAWIHAQSARLGVPIVPIPGTKRPKWAAANVAATQLHLDDDTMRKLEPVGREVLGARFDGGRASSTERSRSG